MSEDNQIPVYKFSSITYNELKSIVNIKRTFDESILDNWFKDMQLDNEIVLFLERLLKREKNYIRIYDEENLKVHFISPILNKIDFRVLGEIRDFYEEPLLYKHKNFILNGRVDFVVANGFKTSEKPLFFIQEFKKGLESTDPETQLLAELISAVELNDWSEIKGAYIIGENWNFLILQKIGEDSYIFTVSRTFNSANIEDLKKIYSNLLFVKDEIISGVYK